MTAEQSVRVYPEQYDFFEKNPVSDVIETGFLTEYYSKNAVRDGKLEFVVEGNADLFIVPSETYLKMVVELDGHADNPGADNRPRPKSIKDGAKVSVVNNLFHSMFESVEVQVNDRAVCLPDKHNPYISYFHMLCNYSEEAFDTYFETSGWSKDTAGHMDDVTGDTNRGLKRRRNMFFGDEKPRLELKAKLYNPLFFQAKALPTQVSMKVLLKKSSDRFVLMHEAGEFSLNFVKATLFVQKVKPVSSLHSSINQMLQEKHVIPYFLKTPSINYMTIEEGSSQFMRDNLFLGKLPNHILIAMVETEAYLGKSDKNPFNFQDFGLIEISLNKDGIPYPRPPIRLDFENGEKVDAYHHFMTSLNAAYSRNIPAKLTMRDYTNGYTLFSYDMSPDQLGSTHPASLFNGNSSIRLEMKFKAPLPCNVTLLVYNEQERLMEIRSDRRVTIE